MRIIAKLDIKSGILIKSIRFDGTRKVGDAKKFSEKYFEKGSQKIRQINEYNSDNTEGLNVEGMIQLLKKLEEFK